MNELEMVGFSDDEQELMRELVRESSPDFCDPFYMLCEYIVSTYPSNACRLDALTSLLAVRDSCYAAKVVGD